MIHPWHETLWQQVTGVEARRAHALLLSGPPGQGKRAFAEAYAARMLCRTPDAKGFACGQCEGCRLRLSGNHPDLLQVVPEADLPEAQQSGGKTKPSTQIVIEQIRRLREQLGITAHQAGVRVVLIDPAEAMNINTANALLKLLEEPPPDSLFLLVSSAPRRLLPTIRSRCQQWAFVRPDIAEAGPWVHAQAGEGADTLLALTGGMPVSAVRLATQGGLALSDRFARDLIGLGQGDPVMLAGDWETWLKSKDAQSAGFDMPMLVDWLTRWVWDLTALRLGAAPRFFTGQRRALEAIAGQAEEGALTDCYNGLLQLRRVANHPLNARLMLEDMLMRYARAVRPVQAGAAAGR